jgi:hypothetical protein
MEVRDTGPGTIQVKSFATGVGVGGAHFEEAVVFYGTKDEVMTCSPSQIVKITVSEQ